MIKSSRAPLRTHRVQLTPLHINRHLRDALQSPCRRRQPKGHAPLQGGPSCLPMSGLSPSHPAHNVTVTTSFRPQSNPTDPPSQDPATLASLSAPAANRVRTAPRRPFRLAHIRAVPSSTCAEKKVASFTPWTFTPMDQPNSLQLHSLTTPFTSLPNTTYITFDFFVGACGQQSMHHLEVVIAAGQDERCPAKLRRRCKQHLRHHRHQLPLKFLHSDPPTHGPRYYRYPPCCPWPPCRRPQPTERAPP